jgi:hypothetical protein
MASDDHFFVLIIQNMICDCGLIKLNLMDS